MQLGDVLAQVTLGVANGHIEVSNIAIDSRACTPGSLFFALPGTTTHGLNFVDAAVANGAVVVVASSALDLPVPVIEVPESELRVLVAQACSALAGHPERGVDLIGVTGTNGKTSVTSFVAMLARAIGWNGSNIGTLTNERTTPSAPELFPSLAAIKAGFDMTAPRSVVALEVSSHALDQDRLAGVTFNVAAFTNLTHDHLDYHGSLENYFEAKAKLFTPERTKSAVIWCDDPYGERLAAHCAVPVLEVRRSDAEHVASSFSGTTFFWRSQIVTTPIIGDYNVDNALMAMTIMSSLGVSDELVAFAMSQLTPVPGRFEVLDAGLATVIVDYAHTPDGLRRLLASVRLLVPSQRVITVFGCGGDRDHLKRPEMGEVASANSDLTIVTSDNPRSESPDAIIESIMTGVVPWASVYRVTDRRSAIERALSEASEGDVIVIAGKGHERSQIVGNEVLDFDDRAVVREWMG